MSDTLEQLQLLKANTQLTGILHEAQINHMKYWSLGLIPTSTEVSIDFNHGKYLIYKIKAKSAKFKQAKARYKMLSDYTKTLLGTDYIVEIYINNSPIFNSADVDGINS